MRPALWLPLIAACAACSETEAFLCEETPSLRPGLTLIGSSSVDFDSGTLGHSREIVLHEDRILVADSNGLPILTSAPDGGLTLLHGVTNDPRDRVHCSTGGYHARSSTFVCGSADSATLDLVDVSNPTRPVRRAWPLNYAGRGVASVPDLEVVGDTVWLAAQKDGLMTVDLGDDGMPIKLVKKQRGEEVVRVVVREETLFILDRKLGLVAFEKEALEEKAHIALQGPPLELAVDQAGRRVAVAMGSEGVQLYDFDGAAFTETTFLQPRCVTTGVALREGQAAVTCLTGLYLYDLRETTPRLAGFFPSRYGMLDVEYGPHGLVVTDWFDVVQFAADPTGVVTVPDVPKAMRLKPDADARLMMRNPADEPMEVDWVIQGPDDQVVTRGSLSLPAQGDVVLTVPYATLQKAGSEDLATVSFARRNLSPQCIEGGAVSSTGIRNRGVDDEPVRGFASVGDFFPPFTRQSGTGPTKLPEPNEPRRVMFLAVDCFLQWPQLEDMAWQARHGLGEPLPVVFFLDSSVANEVHFRPESWMANFNATQLTVAFWPHYAYSIPDMQSEPNAVRVFERTFSLPLPGADFPHDYVLDRFGVVDETSRVYRGRWRLLPKP